MYIEGLTVCVDFADFLAVTLHRWTMLDRLIVVTSTSDESTYELVEAASDKYSACRIDLLTTDAFYERGADFNKGAAIAEAAAMFDRRDWILLFDVDILPPALWRGQVEHAGLEPGYLYGAWRYQADWWYTRQLPRGPLARVPDREYPGYFALFHASDPGAQVEPLVDTCWRHAGNYDTQFQNRWGLGASEDRKRRLDLRLVHLGNPGVNWHGRRPDGAERLRALYADRQAHGGAYEHERID